MIAQSSAEAAAVAAILMGNQVTTKMCCGEAATADAMGLVNVEQGLGPGSLLKDLPLQGLQCTATEDEAEFDFDVSLSTSIRPRTKAAAAVRRQLLKAARQDDAPAMLQLVADGADLGDVGEVLRLAAYRGSSAVVRELVAVGLGVNEACPDTGLTSLQLAAGGGHILVCELLLDAMADPCAPGPPALSLAKKKGHTEVEEVIERHTAARLLAGRGGEEPYSRAHVLPRVSPVLSEAVMMALSVAPLLLEEPDAAAGRPTAVALGGSSWGSERLELGEHAMPPGPLVPWPERPSAAERAGPL